MNVDVVAKKLTVQAKKITTEKGPLVLFGLLLREKSPDNLWDVVIAAPWLNAHEIESFRYLEGQLREALTDGERAGLSRMVLLDHDGSVVHSMLESFKDLSGRLVDVHHMTEGGAVIRRAYVIVAEKSSNQQPRRKTKRQPQSK